MRSTRTVPKNGFSTMATPAAAARSPESAEHQVADVARDPLALIGHGQRDSVVGGGNRNRDRSSAVANRVVDEIRQHLIELVGI